MKQIILQNPFDAHMHWRQKSTLMNTVACFSMNQFSGGLLMPNTDPKLTSLDDLYWYRGEVNEVIKAGEGDFLPIFTYYLSTDLTLQHIRSAWSNHLIHAIKYYPKGGTTGSDKGLVGFNEVRHILEEMQRLKIPLLIHGETPGPDNDPNDDYEREEIFMETELVALVKNFPELRIVLEHITTAAAVDFVLQHQNVIATITSQHCLLDRRATKNGLTFEERKCVYDSKKNGSYPSLHCRPVLKHKNDMLAIRRALLLQAKDNLRKFGLGTDTAPHTADKKYCECGACGVFSAPIALELYAMAFEEIGILDHLSVFACEIMPEFYGIKDQLPKKTVVLSPDLLQVLPNYNGIVTPFAGMKIPWTAIVQ